MCEHLRERLPKRAQFPSFPGLTRQSNTVAGGMFDLKDDDDDPRVEREFARLGITVDRRFAPAMIVRRFAWPRVVREREPIVRWEPMLKHVQRVTS